MRVHPLAEVRTYANLMLTELRAVIPSFLKRVDRPDRGGRWSEYLRATQAATRAMAHRLCPETPADDEAEVVLTDFDPAGEVKSLDVSRKQGWCFPMITPPPPTAAESRTPHAPALASNSFFDRRTSMRLKALSTRRIFTLAGRHMGSPGNPLGTASRGIPDCRRTADTGPARRLGQRRLQPRAARRKVSRRWRLEQRTTTTDCISRDQDPSKGS